MYWMNLETVSSSTTDDTVAVSFAKFLSSLGMSMISQLTT